MKQMVRAWAPPAILRIVRPPALDITYEALSPDESCPVGGFAGYHAGGEPVMTPAVRDNLRFLDEEVAPCLGPSASLLDVGCGEGFYRTYLARYDWSYTGVDRSEESIAAARNRYPETPFHVACDTLPFADASFDLVFASGVLQYCGDDWRRWLGEMVRVARQYVALTRLPTLRYAESCCCIQRVRSNGHSERSALRLITRCELIDAFTALGCSRQAWDYSGDIISVAGIEEPVVHTQSLWRV